MRLDDRIDNIEKIMNNMEKAEHSVGRTENQQKVTPDCTLLAIKKLEYRSLDTEARSRRSNILVHNCPEEEGEDVVQVFKPFVSEKLKVCDDIVVQHVHRLGPKKLPSDKAQNGLT